MIRWIGLKSPLRNLRITTRFQRNGTNSLLKNQGTSYAIQYVKRPTFFTTTRRRTFDINLSNFSLSTLPKLVPKFQCRPFHATQPARAIPLPAFLLALKAANVTIVIRTLSNLLLSFLPFALRKNPKTGRPRRLLIFLTTVIPLTGFCMVTLMGLEQAPHTGRWRVRFLSEEEEKEICNVAFLMEIEKYKDKFLPNDRIESIFVHHVAENLIKGLNNDLMTLKSFKNLNEKECIEEVAKIVEQNVVNMKDESTDTQDGENEPIPFEIYIIEDDENFNAVSFGATKKMIIFTGWLNLIDYNEEYLAVTLSHEIAHILQRHSSESLGFNQILYMFADTARTLLWFPFLAAIGPLLNDYLNTAAQKLVETYTSGRYNQKAEKEADIVGLHLMALSGYHPKKAIELWNHLSLIIDQNRNVVNDVNVEPKEPQQIANTHQERKEQHLALFQSLQEFFASHPLEEVRARYLVDVLPDAEQIYEKVVAEGGKAKLFHSSNKPIEAFKDGDQIISKIWNGLRYLIGLNPES
ncbi:12194_t:CDS:2 [Funneliformis caledonium]|uniref:12194_t:CDS:1 n=1 Tax=Funneliformis caledonium TaxID=1117310 RepID=A0A9N9C535_9GLOM|nr:12194_t:CDS:2 [Funneliformis caledonium]